MSNTNNNISNTYHNEPAILLREWQEQNEEFGAIVLVDRFNPEYGWILSYTAFASDPDPELPFVDYDLYPDADPRYIKQLPALNPLPRKKWRL